MKAFLLLVFLFFSFFPVALTADDVLTPHKLFELKAVAEVAISPDQSHIAFTLIVPRPFHHQAGSDYRELYVYNVETRDVTPFIIGRRQVSGIGWTPGSDAVTFRANLDDQPGVQVYSLSLRGGAPQALTAHPTSIIGYAFADENTLAFTATGPAHPTLAEQRNGGLRIEVYEEEWTHRNLYVLNLQNGRTRQITEGVTIFDFVVSPNGKTVAAAVAPRNLVDDSYMFKRIHRIDLQSGHMEQIMNNPGKLANMAFSPDGSKLAFRGASKLEDSVEGSLYVMDLETDAGAPFESLTNYVEGMELSVIDFCWLNDEVLLYAAEEGVDIVLSEQSLDASQDRRVRIEPEQVVFRSFHLAGNMVAFAGNTWQHPNELFTFSLETDLMQRHTSHNPWLAETRLGKQRKFVYEARDGMEIEGVLIYPLNYRKGETYPLINWIHGGPEAAVQNGWSTFYNRWGQIASARGYFVFMPNYRASSGRGVDFTMAGYGDLVGVEYNDVLDGIDRLVEMGYVDMERVGIGGGSYGGYFSAWSATRHTDRFAAAVMFVGISNQISKRYTTDIPYEDYYVHWGYWTRENPEEVFSRSPVKFAHLSLTPTLILHGDSDPRVHPSQSLEMYRALQERACAASRLIWYEGEGHGNARNVHRLDYIMRTMRWFDFYLLEDNPRESKPDKFIDYNIW